MSRASERRILFAAMGAVGARDFTTLNGTLERTVAWNRLLRLAEANGLCPLLLEAFRLSGTDARLPVHVLHELEQRYHCSAMRNNVLLDGLGKILDAFADNGIPVVVLKGAALLETLWRNIALRPMADIDLLLRQSELEHAQSVLKKLGYEECVTTRTPEWYRTRHHHLVPHVRKETGIVVELHRDIVTPESAICVSTEALWERAFKGRIAGREAQVLCFEDMLIHLCLHMACDDPFAGKARSLADIALLLQRWGHKIDWSDVVSRGRNPRMARFLHYPLLLAQERCGGKVPNDAMAALSQEIEQGKATISLLRHLMPLGLFRDTPSAGILPPWVVQRWCEALLSARSVWHGLWGLASALALSYPSRSEATGPSLSRVAAGVLTIPFRLLRRAMRSRWSVDAAGGQSVQDHSPETERLPAIEIRDLVKLYPQARRYREMLWHPFRRKEIRALEEVTLTVAKGEVFGLLGPNGAGKTTLIKILATLILPTEGIVRVGGRDVETCGRAIRERVGYVVSEDRSFYWRLTGRQNLNFYAALNNLFGKEAEVRIEEVAEVVDMRHALDRRFLEYSAGMRQRLAIARGLITRPSLLLLDEPTRALDPVAARDLRRFIRQNLAGQGRTVLLATHNLQEAEALCNHVAVLNRGRIVTCDAPGELRRRLGEATHYRLTARALPDEAHLAFHALRRPYRMVSLEPDPSSAGRVILRFESGNDGSDVPAAMAELISRGLAVESFGPEERSLEDIFADLVE